MNREIEAVQLEVIDAWLDAKVSQRYKDQPLAQDWARVTKVVEEAGEAIEELILWTGQNPRKQDPGFSAELTDLLDELADTAATALLGMTHFTKDGPRTLAIFRSKLSTIYDRARNAGFAEEVIAQAPRIPS